MFIYLAIIVLSFVPSVYPASGTGKYKGEPQPRIPCYDCVVAWDDKVLPPTCNENTTCKGVFCYRGPNAAGYGIKLGCMEAVPMNWDVTHVSLLVKSRIHSPYENFYCRNDYLCNGSSNYYNYVSLVSLIFLSLLPCFFLTFIQV